MFMKMIFDRINLEYGAWSITSELKMIDLEVEWIEVVYGPTGPKLQDIVLRRGGGLAHKLPATVSFTCHITFNIFFDFI